MNVNNFGPVSQTADWAGTAERPKAFIPALLFAYVFFIFSRFFEAGFLIGLQNLYLILVLSAVALLTITLNGEMIRAAKTTTGILFLLFTFWCFLVLPFSQWRSESLWMLLNGWLKSLAAFFIVVGLAQNYSYAKKTFTALGLGAITLLFMMLAPGGLSSEVEDRFTSFGSMGNANSVAFHVLIGIPFILLLVKRANPFIRLFLVGTVVLSVVVSLKTASRTGLIILAAMLLVALLRVSFGNKIKILLIAAIGLLFAVSVLDQVAIDRFRTLFFPEEITSMAGYSAKVSADSRKYLLEQSIELTWRHPLTGVGMGVFAPASAALSDERGEPALWLVSHNSYTQLSSETGLVGFGLMIGIFVTGYAQMFRLNSAARRLDLPELNALSLCMILSFVTLSIYYFFDSLAYDYYLPLFAGASTALAYTSRDIIAEAEGRQDQLYASSGPKTEPSLESDPAGAVPATKAVASVESSQVARQYAAPRKPNPYRFGRRRVNPK